MGDEGVHRANMHQPPVLISSCNMHLSTTGSHLMCFCFNHFLERKKKEREEERPAKEAAHQISSQSQRQLGVAQQKD